MVRLIKKSSHKAGSKPGTLMFVGEQKTERPRISIIDFSETEFREMEVESVEQCFPYRDTETITWIDVVGLHDVTVISRIGEHFGLHPLVMEDIVHTGQRPKAEETGDFFYIVLKMIYDSGDNGEYSSEQVSILFGKNVVISFQEKEGDVFNAVRERIRTTIPRVRFMGADYLAYSLIDAIVDNYFIVLEKIAEHIEDLEDDLVAQPTPEDLARIQRMKRELILMRKRIWPLRELVGTIERSESKLIHDYTRIYIRDLYEHVIQVIDTVETFREMLTGLLDIYLSSVSNRMNEVMKVLTIIATIFIPLGFLAGVYGMNFNPEAGPFNMPELGFEYGYISFWLIALLIGGGLFWFFRKRGWL